MLTFKVLEAIEKEIEKLFGKVVSSFIGSKPSSKKKSILFTARTNNLGNLFITALNNRKPTQEERDQFKVMVTRSNSYVQALKDRTKAKIANSLNAYLKENSDKAGIKEVLRKELGTAENQLKVIVNAESNGVRNSAIAMQIKQVAKSLEQDDPTVFYNVIYDDRTAEEPEKNIHLIKGTKIPRVWKLSELSGDYWKKGMKIPSLMGGHPNCFLGGKKANKYKVFTEHAGYIPIGDIKIGDRVLTHTGKFKKVINTLSWYNKKHYGDFVDIKYKSNGRDGEQEFFVRVTPEHLFLTNKGWTEAKDLKKDHKLLELWTKCATCKKPIKPKPKRLDKKSIKNLEGFFCSNNCSSKFQWKSKEHRENIAKKSSEQIMKVLMENPDFCLKALEKAHKKNKELIRDKKFWAQKEENLEILQKNIAVINQKLQKNKTSKEELKMLSLIKEIFPNVEHQKILKKWCADFVIEDLKINIEYDGGGHYLPVYTKKMSMENFLKKQEGRDKYLNKCGYHILRYSKIPKKEELKNDIIRVSNNGSDNYFFENKEIISIKYKKNQKQGFYLHDITVEDDESFVVNGIVSHNCRCFLTYIPPGYAFNEKGEIYFKEIGWDEISYQREKYEMP